MMKRSRLSVFLACILNCYLFAVQSIAADVHVYAEGAYTSTELAVYIYADINGPAILSYGVKLTYDPAVLTIVGAVKNEAIWYMGDGVTNHSYMNPEVDVPAGTVIIIGGRLDAASPRAGVWGGRVLLGKIFFDRTESSMPFGPNIGLTYGRMTAQDPPQLGDYKNFVAIDGTVMDGAGVAMGTMSIYERGDANGDGVINIQDVTATKYYMTHGGPDNPWKDCNADEVINIQDIMCIKQKF